MIANLWIGYSGIFGYVNYLVEKDRKYILDTLVNGMFALAMPSLALDLVPPEI